MLNFEAKKVSKSFVELFIVILGVIIALAADSWREDQIESQEEKLYLQRLSRDLNDGIENLNREQEIFARVRESALILSEAIESNDRLDDESFVIEHFVQAGQHGVDREEMEHDLTFQEMIGSGRLGLIEDPVLRARLVAYYREANRLITGLQSLPPVNRSFTRTIGLFPAEFGEYGAELTSVQREKLITLVHNDPEILGLLRRLHGSLVFMDRLFQRLIPTAQELVADIELAID
jgi:hypothetical protein